MKKLIFSISFLILFCAIISGVFSSTDFGIIPKSCDSEGCYYFISQAGEPIGEQFSYASYDKDHNFIGWNITNESTTEIEISTWLPVANKTGLKYYTQIYLIHLKIKEYYSYATEYPPFFTLITFNGFPLTEGECHYITDNHYIFADTEYYGYGGLKDVCYYSTLGLELNWFPSDEKYLWNYKSSDLEKRITLLEQLTQTLQNAICTVHSFYFCETTTTTTIPTTTTITSTTILTTTTTIQSTTLTTIQTTTTLPPTTTTIQQNQCQQRCQEWYGKNGICRSSCLGGERYAGLLDCSNNQRCCCV